MTFVILANRDVGVIHSSVQRDVEVFIEFGPTIVVDQKTDDPIAIISDGDRSIGLIRIVKKKIGIGKRTQIGASPGKDPGAGIVRVRNGVVRAGVKGKEIVILLGRSVCPNSAIDPVIDGFASAASHPRVSS